MTDDGDEAPTALDDPVDTGDDDAGRPRATSRVVARAALIVFVLAELFALPLLIDAGKRQWFYGDDWFFLVVTSYRTLFRTNTYGHWEALPIVAYHLLWQAFGLRNFTAYVATAVILHLITAALIRTVMRRAGCGPWVSTIAATMLVLFGAGAAGIVRPVQITFLGSLAFGLAHLLLADHDGRIDYRDALGLVCGLAGLMCSNVSIAMVASVGLAVLLRRGWRLALLHTVPLALIYIAWWEHYARSAHKLLGKRATAGQLAPFLWNGIRTTFEDLGHFHLVGLALAAMLVVGLIVGWMQATPDERRRAAPAVALSAGAVIFIGSAGLIRASPAITPGAGSSYISRYAYVSAALLLPALAVATSALIRRWRFVGPLAIILLLVGLPGNYNLFTNYGKDFSDGYKRDFLVLANSPVTRALKPTTRVYAAGSPGYMTAGWLARGVASGRIPKPDGRVTGLESATAALRLSLSPYVSARHRGTCRPVHDKTFVLQPGQQIFATGALHLGFEYEGAMAAPLQLLKLSRLQALTGPLPLSIVRYPSEQKAILWRCAVRRS
jgi:hypothetical protein